MKLWKKSYDVNSEVEKFTVGNDYIIDKKLVEYDIKASIVHAKMLNKIKILSDDELEKIIEKLNRINLLNKQGQFNIYLEDEDCHTAIEKFLTNELGETGKKIHTCRSRNDQVLTAMRLYEKDNLEKLKFLIDEFNVVLKDFIKDKGEIKVPGFTHMQKAMPTDIKSWFGAYVDSFEDNRKLIVGVSKLIDQSPLGTAAGFGVPIFNIDREFTAKNLGFERVLENPIYAQMSRGKFEANIINALSNVMFDLNKLSTDLITFNMDEFNFFDLPVEFCTGSSIMPQKKNPDVLELIRAKYHILIGEEVKLKSLIANLISGYNRDLQITKEPVFNSFEITISSLEMMINLMKNLIVNEDNCFKSMSDELYATHEAYKLVRDGMSFRDAYRLVGEKFVDKK